MALTPLQYRSHMLLNRGWPPISHILMVTFPFVTFFILKPTVGIMSSLNCPTYSALLDGNVPASKSPLLSRFPSACHTKITTLALTSSLVLTTLLQLNDPLPSESSSLLINVIFFPHFCPWKDAPKWTKLSDHKRDGPITHLQVWSFQSSVIPQE